MGLPHAGHARRELDEYVCSKCRKRWAIDDPDPPECTAARITRQVIEAVEANRTLQPLEAARINAWVPLQLPAWLRDEMLRTFEGALASGKSGAEAMERAYRRLLDAL